MFVVTRQPVLPKMHRKYCCYKVVYFHQLFLIFQFRSSAKTTIVIIPEKGREVFGKQYAYTCFKRFKFCEWYYTLLWKQDAIDFSGITILLYQEDSYLNKEQQRGNITSLLLHWSNYHQDFLTTLVLKIILLAADTTFSW